MALASAYALELLLETLEALGLARAAVDYVIPTHVHLDHAGGVGLLMRELPGATLICHPRGLRHMVDPSQLWASATAVYELLCELNRELGTAFVVVTHDLSLAAKLHRRVTLVSGIMAEVA